MSLNTQLANVSATAAAAAATVNIKGQTVSVILLSCAEAASGVDGQPADTTLTFVVPFSVATDMPFYSKSVSATAASQIVSCALANPGAVNATYTLTLGAGETFTATLAVYRAI